MNCTRALVCRITFARRKCARPPTRTHCFSCIMSRLRRVTFMTLYSLTAQVAIRSRAITLGTAALVCMSTPTRRPLIFLAPCTHCDHSCSQHRHSSPARVKTVSASCGRQRARHSCCNCLAHPPPNVRSLHGVITLENAAFRRTFQRGGSSQRLIVRRTVIRRRREAARLSVGDHHP